MKRRYRNTAFLLELTVNILVFAVSCAVLVGLFGKAWQLSRDTRSEAAAANEVLAVAETVKAQGLNAIPGAKAGEGRLYYDQNWQSVAVQNPYDTDAADFGPVVYAIRVTEQREKTDAGVLVNIRVSAAWHMPRDGSGPLELCTVETAVYHPGTGGQAA